MNPTTYSQAMYLFGFPLNQPSIISLGVRFLVSLAVIVVGLVIAKALQGLIKSGLEKIRLSKLFKTSPVAEYTKDQETALSIEHFISEVVFWILMLVVLDVVASVASMPWLSKVLGGILSYLPNVISAGLIVLFGALLAGLLETLVKNTIKPMDARLGRLSGKIVSYVTMALATLIAVSELGIAREYILIIFIGIVASVALATGLAVGLGGQFFVRDVLDRWQKRWQEKSKQT